MSVKITTFREEVVYEGPGRIRMGSEARGVNRLGANPVVVETWRLDGMHFQADLTDLLEVVHSDWVAQYPGLMRGVDVPEWTLRLDLSDSQVTWLRNGLTRTADEQAVQAEAERTVHEAINQERRRRPGRLFGPGSEINVRQAMALQREVEGLGENPDADQVACAVERVGITMQQALSYLETLGQTIRRAREAAEEMGLAFDIPPRISGPESITLYDDLIDSTRAEFLPDPHRYTTPRTNAMNWSPPADGEKVARCP